jgi:hypothetical protein
MSLAFRNIPLSAIAFAAAMPLALVACGDDSSSASNEEQPGSSSDETVLSSSSNVDEEDEFARIETLCITAGTKIGGVCGVYGYIPVTGSVFRDCYLYTEDGWVSKGRSFSYCSEYLSNSEDYTDVGATEGCPAESEGVYKTVLDTIAVYDNGNVMEWTSYYHCESGEWVKTECRDPLDACTADNEGEMKNVVCSQQPDNPKAAKTEWDFVCKDKKWEKMSAEESRVARINAQCTKDDTKIGDVCSIISGGNVAFGIMPNLLTCYVYTEEGWVSKASGSVSSTCEELLNAPADSIEVPADTTEAPAASAAAED